MKTQGSQTYEQPPTNWTPEMLELLRNSRDLRDECDRLHADLAYADRRMRAADRMAAAIDNSTYVSAEAGEALRLYRESARP